MRDRRILKLDLVFGIAASLLLLLGHLISPKDISSEVEWPWYVFAVIFLALSGALFLLHKWFLQRNLSVSIWWLHLVGAYGGQAVILYLALPWGDGQDLNDMMSGLLWLFLGMLLLLIALISAVVLLIQRCRIPANSEG